MTNSSHEFEPYHKWFGIAAHEQPPNHYRLLRIALFESDPEVIENAYEKEMADLKAQEHGQHGDLVESISREVIAAHGCLVDSSKKEAYDAELLAETKADTDRQVFALEQANRIDIDQAVRTATSGLIDDRNRLTTLAAQVSARERQALLEVDRLRSELQQLTISVAQANTRLNVPEPGVESELPRAIAAPHVEEESLRDPRRLSVPARWLAPLNKVDQLLANLAGDGNALLHLFLRIVAVMTLIAIFLGVILLAGGGAKDQGVSETASPTRNAPPKLAVLSDRSVIAGKEVTMVVQARDPDDKEGALRFSLVDPPAGATIDAITGQFRWTPTAAHAEQEHRITVRASDDGTPQGIDEKSFVVTVFLPNRPPMLEAIGDTSVTAGEELRLTARANDPDAPSDRIRFSLVDAPPSVSINADNGQLQWSPTMQDAGRSYQITLRVEDNGTPAGRDEKSFMVTVTKPNRPPILEAIGNTSVMAGEELRLTVRAKDPDASINRLRFSLVNAPPSANIDADNGQLQWKPTMQDAGRSYPITIRVEDEGTPLGVDEKSFMVTVTPDPNVGTLTGQERDDNGLKMKFCWCSPVKFTMGSPADEPFRISNEDQVAVELTRGFWLGKYEVTQDQWVQVMESKPWSGKTYVKEGADYPATYVSWDDGMEFCSKLTEQERREGHLSADWQYSLPTEAQWEYACRAGTSTRFSFGDDESRLSDFAWFDDNTWRAQESYAHRVGVKKPNAWGLYDMHGNVWEWCRDQFAYKLPGRTNPEVTSGGSNRVNRGGSWRLSARDCRSAYRSRLAPSRRDGDLGFRVALVPSSE